MRLVPVDDPADDRLDDYVRLTDAQHRRRGDTFLCEGTLVIRRALELDVRFRSLLLTPDKATELQHHLEPLDVTIYVAERPVMHAVTGFDIHRGAIAAAERPPDRTPEDLLRGARTVAVLEGINDHENLGALFRNAAAFGVDAVLLDPTTADPLYRRSVRVSLGHVLAVPFGRIEDFRTIRKAGFELVALTPDLGAEPIDRLTPEGPIALMLGAEGAGLSAQALAAADRLVRIPIDAAVDSLNVATAAAIAFHHRFQVVP